MPARIVGLTAIVAALVLIGTITLRPASPSVPSPSAPPGSFPGSTGQSDVHVYQWMSGDIYGETDICRFAVSGPDQPLGIQPVGVTATGTFQASAATFAQLKRQFQQAAARGSVTGRCDDI